MDMSLQPREGSSVPLRRVAESGRTHALIYASVDALIERVFGVPGPCSGQIAFAVTGKGGQKEIYVCNFDGTGSRRLTHNSTISTEPSWGRGGSLMVYTLYQNNATSVILMDMQRDRQRLLSRHRGLNSGADLSPDGNWAALCLSRDQRIELYLLSVASGQLRRLTNDLAVESSPCWSPKGSQLCYVSDRAGNPQLYVMSASGGRSVRLLSERDEAVSPDWSPVSNRICFSTRLGGHYVIAYVDMSDASRKREIVTLAAGDWEAPSWSPDGRNLVCSRKLNGRRELYLVDTWQRRLLPVTQGGDHSLPSWSD
jgi:TolB protein